MTNAELCRLVDHTLLKQTATWADIQAICDEAMEYNTASVCIPPCYVRQAVEYMAGKIPVCTVIGFPNGNTTTASKVNIMFMACGQMTFRPNTFHKAIIINGNPGNAPLLNSTLLKSPVIAHL